MSFHPIVIDTRTWNQTGSGLYTLSTTTFGGVTDQWKIAGGKTSATGITNASCTRIREKDVTVGTDVVRRKLAIVMQIQSGSGFTSTEIDAALADLSTLWTVPFIDRLMLGES